MNDEYKSCNDCMKIICDNCIDKLNGNLKCNYAKCNCCRNKNCPSPCLKGDNCTDCRFQKQIPKNY